MPPQLLALSEGPNILLDKPILLLGRHPECDIQIDSRKISRRHCCIAQVNDYLVVRDLGSTNGVRINGARIEEDRLNEGDELTIGTLRYQVCFNGEDDGAPRLREAREVRQLSPGPQLPIDDDDALESSEEPVPLAEPGRPSPCRPLDPGADGESFRQDASVSHILPDDLKLAPPSDAYPSLSNPPGSGSRPQG